MRVALVEKHQPCFGATGAGAASFDMPSTSRTLRYHNVVSSMGGVVGSDVIIRATIWAAQEISQFSFMGGCRCSPQPAGSQSGFIFDQNSDPEMAVERQGVPDDTRKHLFDASLSI